jgi:hypothetical protein
VAVGLEVDVGSKFVTLPAGAGELVGEHTTFAPVTGPQISKIPTRLQHLAAERDLLLGVAWVPLGPMAQ